MKFFMIMKNKQIEQIKVGDFIESLVTKQYVEVGKKYEVVYIGSNYISIYGDFGYGESLNFGEFKISTEQNSISTQPTEKVEEKQPKKILMQQFVSKHEDDENIQDHYNKWITVHNVTVVDRKLQVIGTPRKEEEFGYGNVQYVLVIFYYENE